MSRTRDLAAGVCLVMATAATMGLTMDGLYRDNALVSAGWLGNDIVTLFVVVPCLALAVARARESARALLVCLGLLAYALYDYALYLFGAAFNAAFLLYVAAIALATLGLIAGLTSRELRAIVDGLEVRSAHRRVGAAVVAVAGLLGLFWVVVSAAYLFNGEVPPMVEATGHPTNIIGALDLWMVVTFGLWGGWSLVKGRRWGYIISAIWTVKSAFYMAALSAAAYTSFRAGALADLAQLALWVPTCVVCAIGATVLLLDVRTVALDAPTGTLPGSAPGSGR